MKFRATKVGSPAPQLPITLEEVKAYVSVTHDEHDAMLRGMLVAAHDWAEETTRRAIVSQAYLINHDKFPVGNTAMQLPLGYITAVASVTYIDGDGASQTWSASNYETDLASYTASRIRPKPTNSYPSVGAYMNAVAISVTAGWSAAALPFSLRQAILLKIGSMYVARVPGDDPPQVFEQAARDMLAPWVLPPW